MNTRRALAFMSCTVTLDVLGFMGGDIATATISTAFAYIAT